MLDQTAAEVPPEHRLPPPLVKALPARDSAEEPKRLVY